MRKGHKAYASQRQGRQADRSGRGFGGLAKSNPCNPLLTGLPHYVNPLSTGPLLVIGPNHLSCNRAGRFGPVTLNLDSPSQIM